MMLILGGVVLSGVGTSKLLLELGVDSLLERYAAAVVLSYLIFFGLVRIWLWYVTRATPQGSSSGVGDVGDVWVGGGCGGGSGGSGGSGGFSLDVDGEGAIILIVLGIAVAALLGVGIYLVYQAPLILGEAAFQGVLAGSLVRATRRMDAPGWAGSVLRSTFVPFLIALAVAALAGGVCDWLCPEARKLSEVLRLCVFD
jgi:hypothetical protein